MEPLLRHLWYWTKKCCQLDSFSPVDKNAMFVLSNFTRRLTKEVDDQPKAIDWLELLEAVQNQVCE